MTANEADETRARRAYCPRCEQVTRIHADKPWLEDVCLECGTTLE